METFWLIGKHGTVGDHRSTQEKPQDMDVMSVNPHSEKYKDMFLIFTWTNNPLTTWFLLKLLTMISSTLEDYDDAGKGLMETYWLIGKHGVVGDRQQLQEKPEKMDVMSVNPHSEKARLAQQSVFSLSGPSNLFAKLKSLF
ncbi:hypothetical protein SK128_002505 [Halocaridina rubra]|uniref:Uncharacterized protein n=1 Tax=Halocaridina rubra TaxID=373956 RepID=A0AAN9FUW6_HALRR